MRKEVIYLVLVFTLANLVSAAGLPEILSLPEEIIACENSLYAQEFEIKSADSAVFDAGIFPVDNFFVGKTEEGKYEIFSKNLTKKEVGNYEKTVYARNSAGLSYQKINVKVLERNNAPEIEDLKVKTISLDSGGDFSQVVFANDVEDGTSTNGNLEFVANFKSGRPIFEINDNGLIQFEATSEQIGVYLVEICARDKGLENLDSQSGICEEDGSQQVSCDEFQLTVSSINRPPTVVNKNPSNNVNGSAGKIISFNITTFDPDGTSADVNWYVDGTLKEFDEGISSLEKSFSYKFKCSEAGSHEIRADVTDGVEIDRVFWSVNIAKEKNCIDAIETKSVCEEKWACAEWSSCQHAGESAQFGTLPEKEYQEILIECNSLGISQETCGFQLRSCEDISSCNRDNKPDEIQACSFSLNPSCSDEIRNCHDGSCEIEVDCGGSCSACASCSDEIKNQDEERVDCGGVCGTCVSEEVIAKNKLMSKIAILIISILVFLLLYRLFRVIRTERELTKNE